MFQGYINDVLIRIQTISKNILNKANLYKECISNYKTSKKFFWLESQLRQGLIGAGLDLTHERFMLFQLSKRSKRKSIS